MLTASHPAACFHRKKRKTASATTNSAMRMSYPINEIAVITRVRAGEANWWTQARTLRSNPAVDPPAISPAIQANRNKDSAATPRLITTIDSISGVGGAVRSGSGRSAPPVAAAALGRLGSDSVTFPTFVLELAVWR